MTKEQKLQSLKNAIDKALKNGFEYWEWYDYEGKGKRFLLGENNRNNGFATVIGVNDVINSGMIWVEYEPDNDLVELHIEEEKICTTPTSLQIKDDFMNLFEKYSPFGMEVSFNKNTISFVRKEKVEPERFNEFFTQFTVAYREYYSLFYIFTNLEKSFFKGICLDGMDC